ncbi:hypothetical protein F511_34300 [Dorcoceras hygrometricum]|uniref:DUF1421 domain-containing protein n=1 Tax=Dorcoceras hygrometricum TaxID=472368 RepID=A0A2Z7B738_9LAMI|nr:hypothetical protein F511_34300 [Dorcoceras hygrometricum]
MASGSSGRAGNSGSKGFDFASDDILCSYEDYGNQDGNNGVHADSSIGTNPNKEFNKSRMARTSVYPTTTYSPPEESSFNQDVVLTVEKTMKKYTDDLMRFLEGISSRLSQLELYCYNLDKSIGEMRTDLVRDHEESELKLKSLEKHMQEVHRSVQILRDKQELADTQKELAKLQLAQKDSSSPSRNEEKPPPPASEEKTNENSSDVKSQQLALVPHQPAPQPALPVRPVEYQQPSMAPPSMPSQTLPQVQAYYLPAQMTNQPVPSHPSQTQYIPAQAQAPDFSRMSPQPMQSQVNQGPQVQSVPPYQQQWSQPPPQPQLQPQPQQQPVQPSQQPAMQPQIRPSPPAMYSSYLPNQSNPSAADITPSNIPVQVSYAGAAPHGSVGPDALPYGYGTAGRPIQPQPSSQNLKSGFVAQSGDLYMNSGSRPTLPPGTAYMMFDGEGGRTHHAPPHPHFQQGAYPPTSIPLNVQRIPGANMIAPQSTRNHPFNELIEKLVSMGYRGDHVVSVIQRLEESGQPVDFNAVLDRLNGHSSGGSQRGWSG